MNQSSNQLLEQVKKLNSFLQTWRSCDVSQNITKVESSAKYQSLKHGSSKDQMVENIVVGFTSKKKKTCTLGHMLGSSAAQAEPAELMKHQHLVKSMKDLQSHLKSLFFDQVKPSAKKHKYVIQDIEHLFISTEIILKTHFGETFRRV